MPPSIDDFEKLFLAQGLDEDTAFLYATAMTDPSFAQDPARKGAMNALTGTLSGRFTSPTPMVPKVQRINRLSEVNGNPAVGYEILPESVGTNETRTHAIPVRKPTATPPPGNPLDPASLAKPVIGSGWPGSAEWPTVPYAVDAQHKKMVGDREKASAAKMLQEYIMAQDKHRAATEHNRQLADTANWHYQLNNNPVFAQERQALAAMPPPGPYGHEKK
jgi:hypothetical protein